MSSQPIPYVTPEEYLNFERSAEFRHEYVFGEIVAMAGGSPNHSAIITSTLAAFVNRLRGKKPCRTFDANLRVSLHSDLLYSYTDGVVVCGELEFLDEKRDVLTNPKLVVEVLSPTTRNYDLGDKTRMYWQIPSLTDLVLIEQDKVWIEYWSREAGGKWDRQVLSSLEDVLRIESLDREIPLTEIYEQIELPIQKAP